MRQAQARFSRWAKWHVPPGLRTLLGVILIVGGIFGFLPVLGFWMVPLGILIISLDIAQLGRFLLRKNRARSKEHQGGTASGTDGSR